MIAMSAPRSSVAAHAPAAEIVQWLEDFAAAVRSRDFAAGRALFADGVFAFGTRADIIEGLADLEANQWRHIWNSTRGYRFDHDTAAIKISGEMAWVAITWHSQGKDATGRWYDRFGRATYVLHHDAGRWVAVHTHHSLAPGR